ncbi:hypothetical protein D9613_009119 [Agrocybe pediades]|uniref:Carboxylic ester hydrolase n=1 Tax=Agrocybe pediades TaxID=84607 RepID=A0A8H4R4J9_9AGAR|nr:hypothetical protein D9613_009119 [Agrocybe pediades]
MIVLPASLLAGSLLLFAKVSLALPATTAATSLVGTTVTLDYATLNGLQDTTNNIISFRGVPYADPPVGNLRWRGTVFPPSKHLGTINAKQFGPACIATSQTNTNSGTSEDCLLGNVFIPASTNVNAKLPVLVWFHGGGFQGGSTHDAPPEMIMQSSSSPMIFVSFEYRLGHFGFLGGSQVKNNGILNAGLHDQHAALRWVNKYIGKFGGDSSRVTIWGESAGAGSTMFQLIANAGNGAGLFHAAMGDSPSLSFTPMYNGPYSEGIFKDYASAAGCVKQGTDTMKCLRSASALTLIHAANKVTAARPATLYVFAPVIDGSFLAQAPVEAFTSGRFAKVPVLFGSNTNEGAFWSTSIPDPNANTNTKGASETTVYNFLRGQWATLTQATFQNLLKSYPLSQYSNSLSSQAQQMYGEGRYICTAGLITGAAKAFQAGHVYQFQ